jgi:arabinofuranan 3-O-arabinosyltransferase
VRSSKFARSGLGQARPVDGTHRGAGVSTPSILTGALYTLIVLVSFLQQPGRATYDTRIELTEDPGTFLRGAFSMWHPDVSWGEIQNQAYGYLFPQGPFFLLGDLVHSPGWVTQRAWSALVLIVAAEGARRVAGKLALSPGSALLAGMAFAFSPRLLGTVGVISAESLPGAVMPWALLPVLCALQGSMTARRAAVLSAAAVVCMAGVNAAEVLGSLPIVIVFILWGVRQGLARWSLLGWWGGCTLVASLWWFLPLLLMGGHYSPRFFDYVENARATTSQIGWLEATRGADHWVSLLEVGGKPWWPAAHAYAVTDWLVVLTAVLSALGVLGLARFQHPMRTPLVLSAGLGLLALTVAHGTWVGSPIAGTVSELLDGSLAAFRNVHKIDPIVRLPLAVGLASLAQQAPRRLHVPAYTLVGSSVLALLQPFLINQARTDGWTDFAPEWKQAAAYLRSHDDHRATWVVPGAGFAIQDWGATMEEPLRAVPDAKWVSRSQIPLIPGQSIRALDGLEGLIESGTGSPGLGKVLARMGIGHVLLRRDLDAVRTLTPDPAFAAMALKRSAGLRKAASFGDTIDIYDVLPDQPRVRLTDTADVATVQGAPEDIVRAVSAGLLSDAPAVLAGDADGLTGPASVVTDGYQRRERAYGRVHDSLGPILTDVEKYSGGRTVPDYPGPPGGVKVVARYDGAAMVTASSSQGHVDILGAVIPEVGPYAAVDGDDNSAWVSSVIERPVGQWLQIDFGEPRTVGRVVVNAKVGDSSLVSPQQVRVTAGDRSVVAEVNRATGEATADLHAADATSVRVTVTKVAGDRPDGPVAFAHIGIDNLRVRQTLVIPPTSQTDDPTFLFASEAERRACIPVVDGFSCDARRARGSEEATGLDRTFSVPARHTWRVTGQAIARSRPGTSVLLAPPGADQVVRSSSVLAQDPAAGSRMAYDGNPQTAWRSEPRDRSPSLVVTWREPRTIRGVTLQTQAGQAAPSSLLLISKGAVRRVDLHGGSARFRPLTTKHLEIRFEGSGGGRGRSGLSVSELGLVGVPGFTRPVDRSAPTGSVCGLGPELEIDGVRHPTKVSGTFGDLLDGQPMRLRTCGAPITMSAGQHRLRAVSTQQFQVTTLTIRATRGDRPALSGGGEARVLSWSDSRRQVTVPTGGARLLSMPENFNLGWRATVGGQALESVRVDGWHQGWLVPTGTSGVITLTYAPQSTYKAVLVIGLAAAFLILLAAVVVLRQGARPVSLPGRPHKPFGRAAAVAMVVMGVVLGGPVLVLGVLAGTLRRTAAPPVGAALIALAGFIGAGFDQQGWELTAQALCAAGVGIAAGSLVAWPRRKSK